MGSRAPNAQPHCGTNRPRSLMEFSHLVSHIVLVPMGSCPSKSTLGDTPFIATGDVTSQNQSSPVRLQGVRASSQQQSSTKPGRNSKAVETSANSSVTSTSGRGPSSDHRQTSGGEHHGRARLPSLTMKRTLKYVSWTNSHGSSRSSAAQFHSPASSPRTFQVRSSTLSSTPSLTYSP
jgi:hypothetical protein